MEQVEQLIIYPLHFSISIVVLILFGLPIRAILDSIAHNIKIEEPEGVNKEQWEKLINIPGKHGAWWLGISERLVFFLSLWVGAPTLVAAWLAFKVASKWESWSNLTRVPDKLEEAKLPIEYFTARTRWSSRTMQRFLVGTALNLLSAFICVGLFYLLVELQP